MSTAGGSAIPAPLLERRIKIETNNNGNCWDVFPIFSASPLADQLSEQPCIHLQKQLLMITGLRQPILITAPAVIRNSFKKKKKINYTDEDVTFMPK